MAPEEVGWPRWALWWLYVSVWRQCPECGLVWGTYTAPGDLSEQKRWRSKFRKVKVAGRCRAGIWKARYYVGKELKSAWDSCESLLMLGQVYGVFISNAGQNDREMDKMNNIQSLHRAWRCSSTKQPEYHLSMFLGTLSGDPKEGRPQWVGLILSGGDSVLSILNART